MSEQSVEIFIDINKELADHHLSPPTADYEPCIFKVHRELRKENFNAYEPTTIAIGPYHRDNKNLQAMEKYKLYYLKQFLQQSTVTTDDIIVETMRELEASARKCYAEPIELDEDAFVRMMLLDGCFIVHFIRKFTLEETRDKDPNDPIFRDIMSLQHIMSDLLLMENQLPFFVLARLVEMTKCDNPKDNITNLVHNCLFNMSPSAVYDSKQCPEVSTDNTDHILGFMHEIWCSSFAKVVFKTKEENQEHEWEFIKCTTELREAGVRFKKSHNSPISLFDIKFENGVMKIPPLRIEDGSEHFFRNIIAYEQYLPWDSPKYVTNYRKFMDCLINTAEDVEILRHKGIIVNWMGDDETVSTMFNKLGNEVILGENHCYWEIFEKVNEHCKKRRNRWLAKLRRNYFHSPWSSISFSAATLLLIFTLMQTIYSLLSYYK